ncbi:MAG TPA: HAMP domain-containing sensor histidine kinase [Gemmatimonadales bacterium]|nr:HAMP domain-containing sensor histidine kinase [Gemmatimonadales bacterium]
MALAFRRRIFVWLVAVAAIPAGVGIGMALLAPRLAAPVGGVAAWDRAAATWLEAQRSLARQPLTPAAREALRRHADELGASLGRARQSQAIRDSFLRVLAGLAAGLAALVALGTVRLAGHLSRQLSRPIDELIAWTGRLTRGEPLPDAPPAKGAPEFDVLRAAFRAMAADLAAARSREVEAAQLRAFRDLARQVAHELKNPLTPLRFATQRLAQEARPDQRELLEIVEGESERIEQMARDFATLGRLPEGPPAPVDLAELMETLVKGTVPPGIAVRIERAPDLPLVSAHYEPLRRALHNLVLNACDACEERRAGARARGEIAVTLRPVPNGAAPAVEIAIRDTGVGIPPEQLGRVFEPYFTTKAKGTGLGLALVRQTIHDHGGSIGVASEPGRSTTFTVTLPVTRP